MKLIPHVNAEILRALADGECVQYMYRNEPWADWSALVATPLLMATPQTATLGNWQWRVKPVVACDYAKYASVSSGGDDNLNRFEPCSVTRYHSNNLKLTFDGPTGKLKAIEIIETTQ